MLSKEQDSVWHNCLKPVTFTPLQVSWGSDHILSYILLILKLVWPWAMLDRSILDSWRKP